MQLACAIITFARKHIKMQDLWPAEMDLLTDITFGQFKGLYQQLERRYYECFPDQAEKSNTNSSVQKSSDKSSSKKYSQLSINKTKQYLQTEIETPDKINFEFSTIVPKSNDKLSSQKTAASSS